MGKSEIPFTLEEPEEPEELEEVEGLVDIILEMTTAARRRNRPEGPKSRIRNKAKGPKASVETEYPQSSVLCDQRDELEELVDTELGALEDVSLEELVFELTIFPLTILVIVF